jgi:hypothetical protein
MKGTQSILQTSSKAPADVILNNPGGSQDFGLFGTR